MQEYQIFEGKLGDVKEILHESYAKHDKEIKKLVNDYESNHRQWMFYLKQNFNLLMYGVGSKLNVIEKFCSAALKDCCVLTVKGFESKISPRDIIRMLVVNVFGKARCPVNSDEAIFTLKNLLKGNEFPVFLVVYNIDGIVLRDLKRQDVLSKLANLPNLHLIATVDHVNSPLLWNEKMLSKFKFLWIDLVTYEPYLYETWNKQVLKKESSETVDHDFSVFLKIYNCCSEKLKKIVRIIIEDRLNNEFHEQQGMSLQDLHTRAREEMLLVGQQPMKSLNNLLKDFYEHNVIRKTNSNCIILMVNKDALSKFYQSEFDEDE